MKTIKLKKISVKNHPKLNEKWLQRLIEEDPKLLKLGDLDFIKREKTQPTGGRLDLLFLNRAAKTYYEVELMLGSTDESHIIRTIEYWDNERRRNPNKNHVAVLVAEEITQRFFNVIYLFNQRIPIIALQLNAYEHNDEILLAFEKILDHFEPLEEEYEETNRNWYEKQFSGESIKIMDKMLSFLEIVAQSKILTTYNKSHVAISTENSKRQFIAVYPRKGKSCFFEIHINEGNIENLYSKLADISIEPTDYGNQCYGLSLNMQTIQGNEELFKSVLEMAIEDSL